jgi:hypothetical protein
VNVTGDEADVGARGTRNLGAVYRRRMRGIRMDWRTARWEGGPTYEQAGTRNPCYQRKRDKIPRRVRPEQSVLMPVVVTVVESFRSARGAARKALSTNPLVIKNRAPSSKRSIKAAARPR